MTHLLAEEIDSNKGIDHFRVDEYDKTKSSAVELVDRYELIGQEVEVPASLPRVRPSRPGEQTLSGAESRRFARLAFQSA